MRGLPLWPRASAREVAQWILDPGILNIILQGDASFSGCLAARAKPAVAQPTKRILLSPKEGWWGLYIKRRGMLRFGGKHLPPAAYAVTAGTGTILATLPLAHLFSERVLVFSLVILAFTSSLFGASRSLIDAFSFLISYILSLTCIAVIAANVHPIQENVLVAVLPGAFVAFRPRWALVAFSVTLILLFKFVTFQFLAELAIVFAVAGATSIIISFIARRILTDATSLIRDHNSLLFRLIAVLVLFYFITTLYFASLYQFIEIRNPASSFTYGSLNFAPTFLDFVFYAGMLTTHGATNFIIPASSIARGTTAIQMLVTYIFSTVYLAAAVNIIASRRNAGGS